MARVDCDHNIAWVSMIPVGINLVECKVHSKHVRERTEPEVLKFDPRVIQEWIFQKTRLKCFNFQAGFEDLSEEVKAFNKENGKPLPISTEEKWDTKLRSVLEECEEIRSAWKGEVEHNHSDCLRSKYSLGDKDEDKVSLFLG